MPRVWIPRRLTTWITPTATRAVAVRLDLRAINGPSSCGGRLGSTCWRARAAADGCALSR
jgi:hypothetical protein